MACDLCGKHQQPLNELRECYQSKDVKAVCDSCEHTINKHLGKVRNVTHNILVDCVRRFIDNLRGQRNG